MQTLKIGDRIFTENSDYAAFYLEIADIAGLSIKEMPTFTTIFVKGYKKVGEFTITLEVYAQNNSDGIHHRIGFHVGFREKSKRKAQVKLAIIRDYFRRLSNRWYPFEAFNADGFHGEFGVVYWLRDKYILEDKPIMSHFKSVISIIEKFNPNGRRIFFCHSSQDKEIVERYAQLVHKSGNKVWLDKWEIKAGDSIVEKINDGLESMTHLLIFLSSSSVNKPWVKKELSVALMRKLQNSSVKVIPVLLDNVKLPAIISDIKYVDCIRRTDQNFAEVISVLNGY